MIFSRRSIQARLNEIRGKVTDGARAELVRKLNIPNSHRLAAMWELLVIHGLRDQGELAIEEEKVTGKRPDITFNGAISFTADITTVSDDGRDEENPYDELSQEIERQKTKLGLPIGGVDVRVGSYRERAGKGERTNLKIPRRGKIREFVRERIMPSVRQQLAEGSDPIVVAIDEDEIELSVTIRRASDGYSYGSYAAYSAPQSLDRNPLYNALKAKAKQLKSLEGVTGIIVCDGDTECLRKPGFGFQNFTAEQIIEHFLSQNSSIDFVLAVSVHEEQRQVLQIDPPERTVRAVFRTQRGLPQSPALEKTFRAMLAELPAPVCAPINGATRALEAIPKLGFHGGGSLSSGGNSVPISKLKISSRELMEVMAGDLSVERMNEMRRWKGRKENAPSKMGNPFQLMLDQGHLPTSMKVISGGEKDDDWIEIEFGPSDPAISKFV